MSLSKNDSDIVLLPGVISRAFLAMGSSRADRIIASISSSSLDILTQRDKENTATKEQMRSLYNVFMLQEILSILKRTKSVDALRKEWPSVAGHVPWFYCERLNSTIQLREECVVTGEMPFCAKVRFFATPRAFLSSSDSADSPISITFSSFVHTVQNSQVLQQG